MSLSRTSLIFLLLFGSLLLPPSRSWSVLALRPDLEVEGFLEAKNILRTPMFHGAKFIMQRNTAQIEAKYYFLREGRAFDRFSTGPLEEATLTVIGRGVYDSIYDIGDRFGRPRDSRHETIFSIIFQF